MRKIIILVLSLSFTSAIAQDDYVAWSSVQLQKKIAEKNQLMFKPIIRHDHNLSSYQNISLDIAFKRILDKSLSAMVLSRTWFLPEGDHRQFFFFDLGHVLNSKKFSFSNRLRYHWALELDGRNDPDYFRLGTRVTFRNDKKLKLYIQLEPWLRADGIYQFQRIRYEPGFNWTINKRLKLDFNYRIEKFFNVSKARQLNVFVTNLQVIL